MRRRSVDRAPLLLAVKDLGSRDIAAWRELAAQAIEPNPFFEPECVLPAARHLGEPDVGVLVVAGGDREWLACMPVIAHLRRWHTRLPVFAAWRNLYGCLGTPLVARSVVEIATERLLEQAFRASRWGVVGFPSLGEDGPVARGLRATLAAGRREPAWHRSWERAVVGRATLTDNLDAVVSARPDQSRSARLASHARRRTRLIGADTPPANS
jgi:hypothetical protein